MVMAPQHNLKDSSDKGVNIFTSELLNEQDVWITQVINIKLFWNPNRLSKR